MAYFYSNQSYAYQLGLYVTTVSQSVENNTSTIYWRLDLLKHSSAYSIAGGSAVFYVEVNTVPQMNESIYFSMSSGQTNIGMRDGYVTIPHGPDGNAAFGVAFSFTPQTGAAYFPGSMAGNGVYTCAAIARATAPVLSADTVELGQSVTVTANPATNTFTHKLYYQIGNETKVDISTLAAGTQTFSWTVPECIADGFTASTSGAISIICETYSGSTLIGTKSVNLTITIPDTIVPVISSVAISEAAAGLADKFGVYVQNKSALHIETSAHGVHGSTIDSIAVDVGGTAYSGADITTGVLTVSGAVAITVTVTDSRGRTATAAQTITVTAYTAPTITVANAVRCNADGTANEEGTSAKFTYRFNVTALGNKNDKSFKIQYKNGSTWTDLFTVSTYTGDSSYVSTVTFATDNAYDVRFVVSDYFSVTTIQKQVAPSFVLMDFGAGGKSMAVGQRSSDTGKLEVDLPAVFNKGAVLGNDKRPTDLNFLPNEEKAGAVEHYLATNVSTTGKPDSEYSHIVHLHWDDTSGWDTQISIPTRDSRDQKMRNIFYRFFNGNSRVWTPWRNMALNAYPVGAIYLSVVNTSPASLFGGTWQAIGQGRMLVGVGTGTDANGNSRTFANGATGGEYTSGQLNHGDRQYNLYPGPGGYGDRTIVSEATNPGSDETNAGVNLMNPYLAVYMWKRTA